MLKFFNKTNPTCHSSTTQARPMMNNQPLSRLASPLSFHQQNSTSYRAIPQSGSVNYSNPIMREQHQVASGRQPSEASSTISNFEQDAPPSYEAATDLHNQYTPHNTSKPKSDKKPDLSLFHVSDFEDNN